MRCVSLKNISTFVKDFSYLDYYKQFQPNEARYKEMWCDQSYEFWVKFIVTLKYHIKDFTDLYDEAFERNLVLFLKALTYKKFSEIKLFIENAAKRHYNFVQSVTKFQDDDTHTIISEENFDQSQIEEMKIVVTLAFLAGCFLEVLPAWESAEPGNTFEYHVPDCWLMTELFPPLVPPLEALIRSKYGGSQNVKEILGTSPLTIQWWKDPVQQQSIEQSNSVPQAALPTTISNLSETKCSIKLNLLSLLEIIFKIKNLSCFKKHYWMENLPQICDKFDSVSQSLLNYMKQSWETSQLSKFHKLLEHCFPPLLHQKYFKIDILSLTSEDLTHLKVAPWFAMVSVAFGDSFIQRIHTVHQDFINNRVSDNEYTFRLDTIDDFVKSLDVTRRKCGAVQEKEECVKNLSDFLFEPCVLAALASEPVLLRQWLSAALITILKLELELVEFKHLPIPEDVEPIIRELISFVIDTKERILVALCANLNCVHVPSTLSNPHVCCMTMEFLVLKSVPLLKFINDESVFKFVSRLKKSIFDIGNGLIMGVQLHEKNFSFSTSLANDLYTSFFGHFLFWSTDNLNKKPIFGISEMTEVAFLLKAQPLMKNTITLEPPRLEAFYLNEMSVESKEFLSITTNGYHQHVESRLIDAIKKIVISCGHFSQQECDTLLVLLENKSEELDILNSQNPYEIILNAASACIYTNTYINLHKDEVGIVACMNRLTAQVFVKDQTSRLIAACAVLLNKISSSWPKKINFTDVAAIFKDLKSKTKESKNKLSTADNLVLQFPKEWQQTVNMEFEMPKLTAGTAIVIKAFETRIGRIFWNASKITSGKHYKVAYPWFSIVHYFFPSFVSILLYVDKLPRSNINLKVKLETVNFLSEVLTFHECLFRKWNRKPFMQTDINEESLCDKLFTLHMVDEYYVKLSMFSTHAFLNMNDVSGKYTSGLPHLKIILQSLPSFPFSEAETKVDDFYHFEPRFGFYFLKLLKEFLCCGSYFPPLKENKLYFQQLHEFYFASMVTYKMMVLIRCQTCFNDLHIDDKNNFSLMMKEMDTLMFDLFSIMNKTEGQNNECSEKMVKSFTEGKRLKFLHKFFNVLISIREKYGSNFQKQIYSKNIPFFEKLNAKFEIIIQCFMCGTLTTLQLFANKSLQKCTADAEVTNLINTNNNNDDDVKSKINLPTSQTTHSQVKKFKAKSSCQPKLSAVQKRKSATATCLDQLLGSSSTKPVSPDQEIDAASIDGTLSVANESYLTLLKLNNPAAKSNLEESSSQCTNTQHDIKSDLPSTEQDCTSLNVKILHCNNCGAAETIPGLFVACEKCTKDKYPVPNFYCDVKCQETRWKEEHLAEHLEFELGILDISQLCTNNK